MAEVAVWRALAERLDEGRPVALAVVVDSRGSSPGRVGALMAVGMEGRIAGTVGGGPAEDQVISRIQAALRDGEVRPQLLTQVHRPGVADASGLVCGGEQRVAVAPLRQDAQAGVRLLTARVAVGERMAWTLGPGGWELRGAPRAGHDVGSGEVAGLVEEAGGGWRFTHLSGPSHAVYLVGGGHVSRELSRLLVDLDFRVGVIEERDGIGNWIADTWSHERLTCPFEHLERVVPGGANVFAAVMTTSPERDAAALDSLLRVPLGYLGLLGSRAKAARLLAGRETPSSLHAPMGVPIGSHTPAEIAVSIAAEMVAVRAAARQERAST